MLKISINVITVYSKSSIKLTTHKTGQNDQLREYYITNKTEQSEIWDKDNWSTLGGGQLRRFWCITLEQQEGQTDVRIIFVPLKIIPYFQSIASNSLY